MNLPRLEATQTVKAWPSTDSCQICGEDLFHYPTFYDAAVRHSRWAWLCYSCFKQYGVGLGVGRGQEYNSKTREKLRG